MKLKNTIQNMSEDRKKSSLVFLEVREIVMNILPVAREFFWQTRMTNLN